MMNLIIYQHRHEHINMTAPYLLQYKFISTSNPEGIIPVPAQAGIAKAEPLDNLYVLHLLKNWHGNINIT